MSRKISYVLLFLVIFFLVLSAAIISAKNSKPGKIEQKVISEAEKEGKARVIVVLKEPAESSLKSEKQRLKARAETKEEVKNSLGSEKVIHEFSSINAFSASLSKADLDKLESDDSVESVYYDIPVKAFLQNSVPLINATATWSLQSNGINLTGAGETICIIDTGVDYTHPDLGNCTPARYEINGTIENLTTPLESDHNYTNNFDFTWNITKPGYSNIGVHFVNISSEATYDYVYILDGNGKIVGTYSGTISDFWSPSVQGDTIYVRLKSDTSVTSYGFYIDQIINGTTNKTYDWSSCSKIVGGWDTINSDPDPRDDNGHGTHVSGIAAANGTINGAAPGANMISIKALDAAGNGVTGDVAAGIEWCTNRSEEFNISVIGMSLGGGLFTTYCDVNDSVMAAAINGAVAKGISVLAAAGNDDSATAISIPACIQNATPIGSTDKNDALASDTNRNYMVQLFATGVSINSTRNGGGYEFKSGTSMATPHAAGAFAIVNQYLRLNGKTRTPEQIESSLNSTGKIIYDSSSGLNYSRLNIYDAILSLDFVSPNVTIAGPEENYSTTDDSAIAFSYNATDNEEISSCTLILNGAASDSNSSAVNTSATNTISKILSAGSYNWSVNCSDNSGNTGNSSTRSLTVNATSTPSSGGGGGGGGSTAQTYTADEEELSRGYSKLLKKNDRINFKKTGEDHSLTIKSVGAGYADIVINSSQIDLTLAAGESRKINFDSDGFYDLLVRLESIVGVKANITIQIINEKIESASLSEQSSPAEQTSEKEQNYYTIQQDKPTENLEEPSSESEKKIIIIAAMFAVLAFLVFYFYTQYKKSFRHISLKKHIIK